MAPNWFVGITVPPIADGGVAWHQQLLADLPPAARPFQGDDLHITVAFLGSVGQERAELAWAYAEGLEAAPFHAQLAGLKPMGNPRRPSALSVVLDGGAEEAIAIIEALRDPMIRAVGGRRDSRPALPHITVARPARKASAAERRRTVAWAVGKTPVGQLVTLTQLALYTWSDDRRAHQFRIVAHRKLR